MEVFYVREKAFQIPAAKINSWQEMDEFCGRFASTEGIDKAKKMREISDALRHDNFAKGCWVVRVVEGIPTLLKPEEFYSKYEHAESFDRYLSRVAESCEFQSKSAVFQALAGAMMMDIRSAVTAFQEGLTEKTVDLPHEKALVRVMFQECSRKCDPFLPFQEKPGQYLDVDAVTKAMLSEPGCGTKEWLTEYLVACADAGAFFEAVSPLAMILTHWDKIESLRKPVAAKDE